MNVSEIPLDSPRRIPVTSPGRRDIAEALERAEAVARVLAAVIPGTPTQEIITCVKSVAGGARHMATADACSLAGIYALLSDVQCAAELARALATAMGRSTTGERIFPSPAIDSLTDLGLALDSADSAAAAIVAHYATRSGSPPPQKSEALQSPVAPARRLLVLAARMLPAGDRARYGEEFGSELADIALAGGGRLMQLAYAGRQLMSAVRLRTALASPRRRSAGP